ncbi:hypothetical protein [Nocardia sp. NPDC046763]|uniref:hypothetical protein n=1 Tax=Nocardia sp. NPDC046763 TaxID=3155256 RepID=UPI003402E97C
MSIDPNNADNEVLVGRFAAELAAVDDADQAIARMPQPITPSGGKLEARVKPQIKRAKTARDTVRRWTPAMAGTALFLALLFAPLTGPLRVYSIGWALFGFWISLGRPGPRATAALISRAAVTVWDWLTVAFSEVSRLLHRADPEAAQRPATA